MTQTLEQTQSGHFKDLKITVHEYARTSSGAQFEHNAVLQNGYSIVKAATTNKETEWKFPTVVVRNIGHQSRQSLSDYLFYAEFLDGFKKLATCSVALLPS